MSLRVWLPLNGNLDNQGLDQVTVTNNGAVVDNNGKIGKCYSFDGSNYLSIPYSNLSNFSTVECSMCVWAKLPEPTSGNKQLIHIGKGSGWANNRFVIIYRTGSAQILTSISDGTNYVAYNCPANIETNTWIHIAAVYKNKTLKLYINGDLKKSYTTTYDISFNSISSFGIGAAPNGAEKLVGYLNDVRIYDHALSPLEVKQISQGLILHYPLNRNGWGQENLVLNSQGVIIDKTQGNQNEYFAWNVGDSYKNITVETLVTISFDLEMQVNDVTTYSGNLLTYNTNRRGPVQLINSSYYFKDEYAIGENINKRIVLNTTLKPRTADINETDNFIEFYTGYNSGNMYKISNFKIELGNKATPWCPNSSDTLATTLGMNDNIQYDTSGYGNNGTRIGNFEWTSDTPKYNVSTNLNGADNCIQLGNISSLLQDVFTINLWFKKDSLGSKAYETLFGGPSGFEMDTRSGSSQTLSLYMASTRGGNVYDSFNFGEWYMVTMVNNGVNELYYINGILVKTIQKKSMPSGNYFIGAWQINTKQNYKGLMSDFRIYTTALSPQDILSLYNNSAYIDNQGNLYGSILREV